MAEKHAVVRSHDQLSSDQLNQLQKALGVSSIENVLDESIGGGFIVVIDDVFYDYSLSSSVKGEELGTRKNIGWVEYFGDGIVKIRGLSGVMSGELLRFSKGGTALALNLEENQVGAIALDLDVSIVPGDIVESTGEILSIGVGKELLGRVVDPLGNPLDGLGEIKFEKKNPLERVAPGVIDRQAVNRPMQTGIKAIDSMIPIGRGQRELIIGDRQTGKTSVVLSTMINQKNNNLISIYVAIGQKRSNVAQLIATLKEFGAMENTIVVSATASDSAAMQYLAAYAGCAIAEYFLEKGEDALVIYDDLTKHAWAYRQISLLLGRPSGREAYPGDIFYAHSRLLERACQLSDKLGGGSITALPIIETQGGDVSAYIPTNVISITDGQIYLQADLFNSGQRPAIDVGNSVSRVGSAAQVKAMKQVAGKLRIELAQYRELEAFAQFASDLDEKTQFQLNRGAKLYEMLKQGWDDPMTVSDQVVLLWAGVNGFLDRLKPEDIPGFQSDVLLKFKTSYPKLAEKLTQKEGVTPEIEEKIKEVVTGVADRYLATYGG